MAILTPIRRLGGTIQTVEASRAMLTRRCVFVEPDDAAAFPEFAPATRTHAVQHMAIDDVVLDGDFTALRVPRCVVEEFNYGKWPHELEDGDIRPHLVVDDPSDVVTIIGYNWTCHNYYHWLHQALAGMLGLVDRLGDRPYRIALPALNAWQEASLDAAGLSEAPRVLVEPGRQYRFRRVAFSSLLAGRTYIHTGMAAFANRIKLRAPVRNPSFPTRIYVARGDTPLRAVDNEAAILDVLRPYGFEPVLLGRYGFLDQVTMMAAAAYVVGPHGAGFANTLFCAPGTRVFEFTSRQYNSACMCMIAQSLGLEYHVHFTDAPGATQADAWSADVDAIAARLRRLLGPL